MDVAKYIVQYDNVMPIHALDKYRRVLDTKKFDEAGVADDHGGRVDFSVRRTWIYDYTSKHHTLLTDLHWHNRLHAVFTFYLNDYLKRFDIQEGYRQENISVLKYENTGFYKPHVDHGYQTPRTYSLIFLVNDDYEGGDLCFTLKDQEKLVIKKKKNKLLIWPSNFMYPHTVEPVQKGTRYSVVSWAL